MRKSFKPLRWDFIDYCAFVAIILWTVAGIIVSLVRYWQFEAYYFDFGIFDQAIWEVSRFQPPIIEHFLVGGKWIFADHFSPSIFLLFPLYWITNRSEIVLIAQALCVGLSGLILYQIGKEVLKNNLLSLSILVSYFLFVGLQNAVITDFHELTVMTLFFMLTFLAILKKKVFLYFLMLLITLGFKESQFLVGVGIGIATFFVQKKWWKVGLLTIAISIAWGIVSIKVIIPAFSGGLYNYSPSLPQGFQNVLIAFVDRPEKRNTLFYSFFSFGFLPIFSPGFWILILQDYGSRFLPEGFNTRWGLGLHYNAESAAIFGVSAIYALSYVRKFKHFLRIDSVIAVILILNAIVINRFVLHGPYNLVINPAFYAHTKDFEFLNRLVARVPKNTSVMTHNNLAGHFSHQRVWLLREYYESYKPSYIVIDNRRGQSPNNFFPPSDPSKIIKKLLIDQNYKIYYHEGDQYIFKRIQ